MLYETLSQGHEFAAMTVTGVAMGAVALIFSGLRRVMCAGKWGCLICDCLMGLVWGAVGCAALLLACRGDARAFHFLAMASGAALFLACVSPAARRAAAGIGAAVSAIAARAAGNRVFKALFR